MPRPSKISKQLPAEIAKKIENLPDKKRGKIDIEQALKMRLVNKLTLQEIADYFGVSRQSIHEALQPYTMGCEIHLPAFKENRADIFALQQGRLLSTLTDADIKAIPADKRIWSAKNLHEMERLERGQSTVNLASIYSRALEDRTDPPLDIVLEPDREKGIDDNDANSGG